MVCLVLEFGGDLRVMLSKPNGSIASPCARDLQTTQKKARSFLKYLIQPSLGLVPIVFISSELSRQRQGTTLTTKQNFDDRKAMGDEVGAN